MEAVLKAEARERSQKEARRTAREAGASGGYTPAAKARPRHDADSVDAATLLRPLVPSLEPVTPLSLKLGGAAIRTS